MQPKSVISQWGAGGGGDKYRVEKAWVEEGKDRRQKDTLQALRLKMFS